MKAYWLIIAVLLVGSNMAQSFCKTSVMESYLLRGQIKYNSEANPICTSITKNCCHKTDILKIHDEYTSNLLPRLTSYYEKVQQSFKTLSRLQSKAMTVEFEVLGEASKQEFCKEKQEKYKGFAFDSLLENLQMGFERSFMIFKDVHSSFMCSLCDFDSLNNVNPASRLMVVDSGFCLDLLNKNILFMNAMNVNLIDYFYGLQDYLDCAAFEGYYSFPFLFENKQQLQKDIKACYANFSDDSLSPPCEKVCSNLNIGAISPIFEGDFKFINDAVDYYTNLIDIIKETRSQQKSVNAQTLLQKLNNDQDKIKFIQIEGDNDNEKKESQYASVFAAPISSAIATPANPTLNPALTGKFNQTSANLNVSQVTGNQINSQNGATFTGQNGGTSTGQNGATFTGQNGATFTGQNGTTFNGQNGGTSIVQNGTTFDGKNGTTSTGKNGTTFDGKNGTTSTGKNGTTSTGKNGTTSTGKNGTTSAGKNGTTSAGQNGTLGQPATNNTKNSTQPKPNKPKKRQRKAVLKRFGIYSKSSRQSHKKRHLQNHSRSKYSRKNRGYSKRKLEKYPHHYIILDKAPKNAHKRSLAKQHKKRVNKRRHQNHMRKYHRSHHLKKQKHNRKRANRRNQRHAHKKRSLHHYKHKHYRMLAEISEKQKRLTVSEPLFDFGRLLSSSNTEGVTGGSSIPGLSPEDVKKYKEIYESLTVVSKIDSEEIVKPKSPPMDLSLFEKKQTYGQGINLGLFMGKNNFDINKDELQKILKGELMTEDVEFFINILINAINSEFKTAWTNDLNSAISINAPKQMLGEDQKYFASIKPEYDPIEAFDKVTISANSFGDENKDQKGATSPRILVQTKSTAHNSRKATKIGRSFKAFGSHRRSLQELTEFDLKHALGPHGK